jgi:hypothetical protein
MANASLKNEFTVIKSASNQFGQCKRISLPNNSCEISSDHPKLNGQ